MAMGEKYSFKVFQPKEAYTRGQIDGEREVLVGRYPVAFLSGVIGAIVVTGVMLLGRALGINHMSIEMLLGTLVTGRSDYGSWLVGFLWHLVNGGVFALFYAGIFQWLGRYGSTLGMEIGVVHWLASGLLIGLTAAVNPFVPSLLASPGFYAANYGPGSVLVLFVAHLAFGAVVGSMYRSGVMSQRIPTTDRDIRAA